MRWLSNLISLQVDIDLLAWRVVAVSTLSFWHVCALKMGAVLSAHSVSVAAVSEIGNAFQLKKKKACGLCKLAGLNGFAFIAVRLSALILRCFVGVC